MTQDFQSPYASNNSVSIDLPLLTELNQPAPELLTELKSHLLTELTSAPLGHRSELLTELKPDSSRAPFGSAQGKLSPLWHRLYKYVSKGHMYYCFMWGKGHSVYGRLHLSGGAVGSPVAEARADLVRSALARSAPLVELLTLIRSFPDAKRGRKLNLR